MDDFGKLASYSHAVVVVRRQEADFGVARPTQSQPLCELVGRRPADTTGQKAGTTLGFAVAAQASHPCLKALS